MSSVLVLPEHLHAMLSGGRALRRGSRPGVLFLDSKIVWRSLPLAPVNVGALSFPLLPSA